MSYSILWLESVLKVGFYFSHVFWNQNCKPIPPSYSIYTWYPLRVKRTPKRQKLMWGYTIFSPVIWSAAKTLLSLHRLPKSNLCWLALLSKHCDTYSELKVSKKFTNLVFKSGTVCFLWLWYITQYPSFHYQELCVLAWVFGVFSVLLILNRYNKSS